MSLILAAVVVNGIKHYTPKLAEQVAYKLVDPVSSESAAKIAEIRAQMESVSMTQEFAKYAKLQRQLKKCIDERQREEVVRVSSKRAAIKGLVSRALYVITGLLTVYLLWFHRSSPVYHLPPDWIHPFSFILSWPTAIPGAISFHVWFIITNITVPNIIQFLIPKQKLRFISPLLD